MDFRHQSVLLNTTILHLLDVSKLTYTRSVATGKTPFFPPENSNSTAMTRELTVIIMPITNSSIRTFQELSLVQGIPTTIVIRQSWQKQQKHCFSHHCFNTLFGTAYQADTVELNNPHHQQHGHELQSLPLSDPQHMTCCYSFVRSERGPSTACSQRIYYIM